MDRKITQLTPEEVGHNVNQISDIDLARRMAEAEKPIRDLARDSEADPKVREMKELLDKEANRIGEKVWKKQFSQEKKERLGQELLNQSIDIIELSTRRRTQAFRDYFLQNNIKTIEDLTKIDFRNLIGYRRTAGGAMEVEDWLLKRGLSLKRSSGAVES